MYRYKQGFEAIQLAAKWFLGTDIVYPRRGVSK